MGCDFSDRVCLQRLWEGQVEAADDQARQLVGAGVAPGTVVPLMTSRVVPLLAYVAAFAEAFAGFFELARRWIDRVFRVTHK